MKIYNSHDAAQGRIRADRAGQGQDIFLRPDGIQLLPHRQCAPVHHVRHCCAGISNIAAMKVTFVQNFTDIDDKMIKPRQ